MRTLGYWIEAMRLRTLPVSVAGVLMAITWNVINNNLDIAPAAICLCFAVVAQIASNFANEYFDYTEGRDRPGREGPRRGVTEGEITPGAMKRAIYICLAIAGCMGLSLVWWGGWWLIAVGIFIAIGVFAYSAGPYPLSTHALGEIGVIFFFGLIPVNFTYYVQSLQWDLHVAMASLAVGLMGANVLIINNYRDKEDDMVVGKQTLCVLLGRRAMRILYTFNALGGALLLIPLWKRLGDSSWLIPVLYLCGAMAVVHNMSRRKGAALTPLLGITSILMFAVALVSLLAALLT